jgi:outer membrane murein-binding lipoprotein Lpp
MGHQRRIAPEIEQWAGRLTAFLHRAWGGRPDREVRRTLGKIGFWIAQPGLDAACQRQLVALQLSRRDVADVATACKRLELQIAQLERQADEPGHQAAGTGQDNTSGRGDTARQLAELRRQHADLQVREERVTAVSRRLMAEINALRDGKEAIKTAYAAAEEAARAVWRR